MKEISKFLLKTIKQNFPKNKNQSSQTISNVPLTASFHHFGIVGNEIVFKVIDDKKRNNKRNRK